MCMSQIRMSEIQVCMYHILEYVGQVDFPWAKYLLYKFAPKYNWNFLELRMSENLTSEISMSQGPGVILLFWDMDFMLPNSYRVQGMVGR